MHRSNVINSTRLKKLRAAGWKVGDAKDFLKLSDEEAMLVEFKLALATALKAARVFGDGEN